MSVRRSRRPVRVAAVGIAILASLAIIPPVQGQPPPASPDQRSAREQAQIDLTGQWVAVITEDWRWRMVTPAVGDTSSLPLNARGQAAARSWDAGRDIAEGNLCKAFGPPGLIRQPTRLRISWEDDDTLLIRSDAGDQTRRLRFRPSDPGPRSLQGHSEASWFRQTQSRGVFGARTPASAGALHVRTTNLTEGYLRPNGVPYSGDAIVKEYFHTFTLPGDLGTWLIVTTVVDDPEYLTTELVLSSQFKRETDQTGWDPRPCELPPPLIAGDRD